MLAVIWNKNYRSIRSEEQLKILRKTEHVQSRIYVEATEQATECKKSLEAGMLQTLFEGRLLTWRLIEKKYKLEKFIQE